MNQKKYLLVSRSFIPSVLLCGGVQLDELRKQSRIEYRFVKTVQLSSRRLNWADVVIFVRGFDDYELFCCQKAKEAGKKTVYVLDDDLPNIPKSISSADLYTSHNRENIGKLIAECDAFLTPSRNLLQRYGPLSQCPALIEEPALMFAEKTEKSSGEKLKIGFAGSVDRTGDLNEILAEAVDRIMTQYGDRVTFEFFGARPAFADKYGFNCYPYENSYEAYCAKKAELNWDIGLAPMPETEFHKYKHYIKFIEYAAFGTAGIYTSCEPYTRVVKDGVNGLLCENSADAWFEAMWSLIENEKLRYRISMECQKEAKERFPIDKCAEDYYNLVNTDISHAERVNGIPKAHMAYVRRYVADVYKKYGLKTPVECMKRRMGKR